MKKIGIGSNRRKHRRPNLRRSNPIGHLSEAELVETAKNQTIERNFGLFGLALSWGNPGLRDFLVKCSIGTPTGLANPSTPTETSTPPKCSHERLTEDGICRQCGQDKRGL